jgi:hypothetical protein
MEPRELWGRHAVLAEAFCAGDERVREAQAQLDEAQADRSRVLAAFAVTVGDAGAVAGLFGLNEREVRVARRTVGKDDARAVADQLLAAASESALLRDAEAPGEPGGGAVAQEGTAGAPAAHAATGPAPGEGPAPNATVEPGWSAALDAVLVGSWQTGVDLRELATELGLDLSRLLARAQQLSAQGRLTTGAVHGGETQAGRHRRGAVDSRDGDYAIPTQQSASWNSATGGHAAAGYQSSSAWYPAPVQGDSVPEMTALPTDWDNALAAWGTFPPPHEESTHSQQPWTQYHLSS